MPTKPFDYLQIQYVRRKDDPMVIKGGRSIGRYDLRGTFDPAIYELVYGEVPEGATVETSPREAINQVSALLDSASPTMRQKLYADGIIAAGDRLDFDVIEAILTGYTVPEGQPKTEKTADQAIREQILQIVEAGKEQLAVWAYQE